MSRILHQAAHSIALAINFVFCGEYDEVFTAKTAAREVTIYAEAFLRIGSMVVHITEDVTLDESDLDEGVAFAASTAYYIYVCIPESGSSPEYAISTRDTYPTGWTDETSRIVGGFTTDGAGDIDVSTLWDLYEKGVWIAEAIGTAKGDLIVFTSAGVPARLGVGSPGQKLIPDPAESSGMKWSYIPAETKTDDYTITAADLGKSLRMSAATAKTFSLPSVGASEDGARITLMKIGAGQVTVDAADSDTIWDSSAGGTIYNDVAAETRAMVTLEYVHSVAKWVIVEIFGTWKTT